MIKLIAGIFRPAQPKSLPQIVKSFKTAIDELDQFVAEKKEEANHIEQTQLELINTVKMLHGDLVHVGNEITQAEGIKLNLQSFVPQMTGAPTHPR